MSNSTFFYLWLVAMFGVDSIISGYFVVNGVRTVNVDTGWHFVVSVIGLFIVLLEWLHSRKS